jgi:hypothetical protein
MYGQQLLAIYERVRSLGLTSSREAFSVEWCGRSPDYLRDYTRRRGAMARVSPRTVAYIRGRFANVMRMLPAGVAAEVRAIDDRMVQDAAVANFIGRWSFR